MDLVDKVIDETFETIENSQKLIGGAAYDLSVTKFYILLEELFSTPEITMNIYCEM